MKTSPWCKPFDWLQTTRLASKDQKTPVHFDIINDAFYPFAEWELKNKRELSHEHSRTNNIIFHASPIILHARELKKMIPDVLERVLLFQPREESFC